MIYGYRYEPIRERVATWIDRRFQIQGYDADNLYPQRAIAARDASKTVKACVDRYAEFLNGEGFTDPALAGIILNRKGHTGNDFLDHIAKSASSFQGFWVHVGYNLNYKVNSVKVINFEYNRFDIPNDEGDFFFIKYCNNWENNPYKNPTSIQEICDYNVFNPDPHVVKEEVAAAGGILNYKGQMFYWTPEEGQYPKCTFDVVLDQAQTQNEIAIFDLAMEQNGFKGANALMWPATIADANEERKIQEKLEAFGGRGAGATLIIENPGGTLKANEIMVPLQMQNTDGLHLNVDKRTKNDIREAFGMPAEIIGQLPESGIFNTQQMQEAYTYYNSITRNGRNIIQRQVKKILDNWYQPITADYSIIPQKYALDATTQGTNG